MINILVTKYSKNTATVKTSLTHIRARATGATRERVVLASRGVPAQKKTHPPPRTISRSNSRSRARFKRAPPARVVFNYQTSRNIPRSILRARVTPSSFCPLELPARRAFRAREKAPGDAAPLFSAARAHVFMRLCGVESVSAGLRAAAAAASKGLTPYSETLCACVLQNMDVAKASERLLKLAVSFSLHPVDVLFGNCYSGGLPCGPVRLSADMRGKLPWGAREIDNGKWRANLIFIGAVFIYRSQRRSQRC